MSLHFENKGTEKDKTNLKQYATDHLIQGLINYVCTYCIQWSCIYIQKSFQYIWVYE